MSDADDLVLGLFPLGIVVLPGEVVPLHIFEERYKKLIGERLEEGEFGVVLAGEESVRECGTTARVAQLIERLDDARMNVLVQGERRFRILEIHAPGDPATDYLKAKVELYGDAAPEASHETHAAVLREFVRMLTAMDVKDPREPVGEGPLSFRLAAAVDFGVELKQGLLESRSEEQRLGMLHTMITSLLPRIELHKEREAAIRGNGKGY